MTVHYGQRSQEWELFNANYYQIVSVLMQVVKNVSTLRVDAPEWHPQCRNVAEKEKANYVDVADSNVCGRGKTNNSALKDEGWKEQKKSVKRLLPVNNNNTRRGNRDETLSSEDEENDDDNVDDDMSDDSSENIKDISIEDDDENEIVNSCGNCECEKIDFMKRLTREMLLNEINTLEPVADMKSNTIQMSKRKIDEKEAEINNIKVRTKNVTDANVIINNRVLMGKKIAGLLHYLQNTESKCEVMMKKKKSVVDMEACRNKTLQNIDMVMQKLR